MGLTEVNNRMTEANLDVRKCTQLLQKEASRLELLALNYEGIASIILQQIEMEFSDPALRRPIPELEDRRDKADGSHFVDNPGFCKNFQGRWVRSRGAGISLKFWVIVK